MATVNSEHPLWFIKDSTIEPFELNLHAYRDWRYWCSRFTSQAINIVREKLVEEKEKHKIQLII